MMRKSKISVVLLFFLFVLMISLLIPGQQRRKRAPWSERSPAIGKKVPELMVYDKDLNQIPLSSLYKDTLLVIQWGGCT
jgi:hypothetical protein